MKYQFIGDHVDRCRVTAMCRTLQVSRSGFYDWRTRKPSARAQANAALLMRIREAHRRSRSNYGAVKTWRVLNDAGIVCGRHRVARLRRSFGIEAKRMSRYRSGYANRHTEGIAPNHLQRNFQIDRPDRVWVGDATFIATREGWLYLAVLLDLYSRRVVGWAMSSQLNRQLVIDALMMAIEHRRPKAGLVHHTDQGVVYATSAYRAILTEHEMLASMSRKGNCHDNAVAEAFFSNLKNELTWHESFETRSQARAAVFDYIELFYNRERIHQALDYLSPVGYEES